MRALLLLAILLFTLPALAESPLSPLKTETPRDTMRTFMDAMNKYREGVKVGNKRLRRHIDRAVRVLEVSDGTVITSKDRGRTNAILLKEVMDRVIVIDYSKIPGDGYESDRWRLKDTEITIHKIESGSRKGEFLFSTNTVSRAREFYDIVKELPYKENSGMGALYDSPVVEKYVPRWARSKTLNMYHWQWFGILIGIFLGLLFKKLSQLALRIGKKISEKSTGKLDDQILMAIEKPLGMIIATAVWFLSLTTLQIDGLTYDILSVAIQTVFSVSTIWFVLNLTSVLTDHLKKIASRSDFPLDDQLVPLFQKALRLFIVVFGTLISAQNLGINVMSLLAGLGLGGLAFALAAQDTAANFFGSVMILWDQPFKVGDWIKTSDAEGTVEEIGFRSTRIRTFYNSEISIPNSKLANENIDNMGRRRFRRIVSNLGVTYDTTPEKLEAFLEGIKNIIKANEFTRKDYYHVVFSGYGASSLDIMLYFFFEVKDWSMELVERQNIYLEILRLAQELDVNFAFPTQTLHVDTFPGKSSNTPESAAEDVEVMKSAAQLFGPTGQKAKPKGLGIFTAPYKE